MSGTTGMTGIGALPDGVASRFDERMNTSHLPSDQPIEVRSSIATADGALDVVARSRGERWRFEPSYWDASDLMHSGEPAGSEGPVVREFEISREEAKRLDERFRPKALPWIAEAEWPQMDRALADSSPFHRFRVVIYEWESGLAD